jgi:hypothetical protein
VTALLFSKAYFLEKKVKQATMMPRQAATGIRELTLAR